jgi:beta-glucosidase
VEKLLKKLTLAEKVTLLAGKDAWGTAPVERLGIPALLLTDGPHAVCAWSLYAQGQRPKTTCFPTGTAIGASWNPALVARVGAALGEETRAMGYDIILGPCINIIRTPLGGRNFETYSEDPHLSGRLAVAYVTGVQRSGAGTSVKHFACNNQEVERFRGDSVVDERTLREIYLPAFEAAVKEARPWTVMCAYNRVNGVYASRNDWLLRRVLKDEWGFDGFVVSDWGAVHHVEESVRAGLDLEMPGPARYLGALLADAARNWQIEEAEIDDAARRILRIVERSGKLADRKRRAGEVNTPRHQRLARQLAEESLVLLKNESRALPLPAMSLRSLAVIGPNAAAFQGGGGGSSAAVPPYMVQPLDALRRTLGRRAKVEYAAGCDNLEQLLPMTPDAKFRVEFFNGDRCIGKPVASRRDDNILYQARDNAPMEGVSAQSFCARWTTTLTVSEGGTYRFLTMVVGKSALYMDGRLILENTSGTATTSGPGFAPVGSHQARFVDVTLKKGVRHRIRLEYHKPALADMTLMKLRFGRPPGWRADEQIAEAAALAARCDAAVIFVGMPLKYEHEGGDRPHMNLPGRQDDLVRAVARANPRTVVVLNVGVPVTMPWLKEVPAVLLAWYTGQEAGNAIARALLGMADPGGRLPVTFPRRYKDNPTFGNYPGTRQVRYDEGVFVGYRHYDRKRIRPMFPFGHGLSYTTFEYADLRVPARARRGRPVRVSVEVRNVGPRAGHEVVQVYVGDPRCRVPRPVKELKAFAKVVLRPGERRRLRFTLSVRDFSFWDVKSGGWIAEPGEFVVSAGSSSGDIRQRASLRLE